MAKIKRPVQDYIISKKTIMEYFRCTDDFFIKPLLDYNWSVDEGHDFSILSYWKRDVKSTSSVIVKKGGVPMIFKSGDHIMVVAIDCVKIGFIFRNDNRKSVKN